MEIMLQGLVGIMFTFTETGDDGGWFNTQGGGDVKDAKLFVTDRTVFLETVNGTPPSGITKCLIAMKGGFSHNYTN